MSRSADAEEQLLLDQNNQARPRSVTDMTMTDIFYLLLSDLGEVCDLSDANENQPRQSYGSYVKLHKGVHNNPKDLQIAFKKKIIQSLSRSVEDVKPLGEPLHTGHTSLELRAKLLDKVLQDRKSIQEMTSQLSQLQDSNKEISRRTEDLKKSIASRATSGEMRTTHKLQEIHSKIKQRRAQLIKDIRYVIENSFPESDVQDILSEALKEALSGKDPYISVEGVSSEAVEVLLRCNLVCRHPHDSSRIRLRDML